MNAQESISTLVLYSKNITIYEEVCWVISSNIPSTSHFLKCGALCLWQYYTLGCISFAHTPVQCLVISTNFKFEQNLVCPPPLP